MNRKIFVLAIALFGGIILMMGGIFNELMAAETKTTTLKAALFHPATSPSAKVWLEWAPKFELLTEKRVKLQVFPGGTLVKGSQQLDAVQRGIADIAYSTGAYYGATVPVAELRYVPSIIRDEKGDYDTWKHGTLEIFQRAFEAYKFDNVKIVAGVVQGGSHLASTKKQIKTPDDLKGLKVRCFSAGESALVKECGGVPVSIPLGQTYEALQRGIVDVARGTLGNFHDFKWFEVCKFVLGWPVSFGDMQILVGKKSLSKLKKIDQEIVLSLIHSINRGLEAVRLCNLSYYRSTFLPQHMDFYDPKPKEVDQWIQKAKPVVDEWLKRSGEFGKEAFEIAKKYNKR